MLLPVVARFGGTHPGPHQIHANGVGLEGNLGPWDGVERFYDAGWWSEGAYGWVSEYPAKPSRVACFTTVECVCVGPVKVQIGSVGRIFCKTSLGLAK